MKSHLKILIEREGGKGPSLKGECVEMGEQMKIKKLKEILTSPGGLTLLVTDAPRSVYLGSSRCLSLMLKDGRTDG